MGNAVRYQTPGFRQQVDIAFGLRLDAVHPQDRAVVRGTQRHSIGVVLADELAVVLGAAMGAGMVAAR